MFGPGCPYNVPQGKNREKREFRVMFWTRAVFLSQGILVIPACPTKGCPQGMSHVKRLGSLDYGVLPTRRSDERDFGDLCVPHKGCPTREESLQEIGISRLWFFTHKGWLTKVILGCGFDFQLSFPVESVKSVGAVKLPFGGFFCFLSGSEPSM